MSVLEWLFPIRMIQGSKSKESSKAKGLGSRPVHKATLLTLFGLLPILDKIGCAALHTRPRSHISHSHFPKSLNSHSTLPLDHQHIRLGIFPDPHTNSGSTGSAIHRSKHSEEGAQQNLKTLLAVHLTLSELRSDSAIEERKFGQQRPPSYPRHNVSLLILIVYACCRRLQQGAWHAIAAIRSDCKMGPFLCLVRRQLVSDQLYRHRRSSNLESWCCADRTHASLGKRRADRQQAKGIACLQCSTANSA